jgi:hypothetical protein
VLVKQEEQMLAMSEGDETEGKHWEAGKAELLNLMEPGKQREDFCWENTIERQQKFNRCGRNCFIFIYFVA